MYQPPGFLQPANRGRAVSPSQPTKQRDERSEGDGTRTRNHRIDSTSVSGGNDNQGNELDEAVGRVTGCVTGAGGNEGEAGDVLQVVDGDLAAVVEAWDQLPAAIRAGIVAMVQASGGASQAS
jgi:hypothetical protein